MIYLRFFIFFQLVLFLSCDSKEQDDKITEQEVVDNPVVAETNQIPDNHIEENKVEWNDEWARTRVSGVQLSRMCINEDSRPLNAAPYGTAGNLTDDHKWIAQTVYSRRFARKHFSSWLDVMNFLSPHVGRIKPATRHRHQWTSMLPEIDDRRPKFWIDCRDQKDECDGDWRVHKKYWSEFRERMTQFWKTNDFRKIETDYGIKPIMWGDRNDVKRFLNRYNNLCVLDTNTINFFLAKNGNGCSLDDLVTSAARHGKKSEHARVYLTMDK